MLNGHNEYPSGAVRFALAHGLNGVVGRQDCIRQKTIVDDRRLVAVAQLGVPGSRRRVLDHGDLENLLEQLPQVALDTEVGQYPGQDDLVDATLAELKDEVVGLRAPHFMRADHNRLAVFDEGFVPIQPVRPGAGEPVVTERIGAEELLALQHHLFDGPAELPSLIVGIEVVGRDKHREVPILRDSEKAGEILNGVVFLDTVADQPPGDALFTQNIVLRVDDNQRSVVLVELHDDAPC